MCIIYSPSIRHFWNFLSSSSTSTSMVEKVEGKLPERRKQNGIKHLTAFLVDSIIYEEGLVHSMF